MHVGRSRRPRGIPGELALHVRQRHRPPVGIGRPGLRGRLAGDLCLDLGKAKGPRLEFADLCRRPRGRRRLRVRSGRRSFWRAGLRRRPEFGAERLEIRRIDARISSMEGSR
jgi:hypothetical protein